MITPTTSPSFPRSKEQRLADFMRLSPKDQVADLQRLYGEIKASGDDIKTPWVTRLQAANIDELRAQWVADASAKAGIV